MENVDMELSDRKLNKPQHFLDVYAEIFTPIRMKKVRVLELGVSLGGSLKLWKDIFPVGSIIGVDTNPECKVWEEDRIQVITSPQTDPDLVKLGDFDIVIDDASHKMSDQRNSFELLWPQVKPGGYYIVEDLETSSIPSFVDSEPVMTDYLKNLVGEVQAGRVESLSFYKDLCVIKKTL